MKKIFVSDFDGTLTKEDFYKIMISDYLGEEGKSYFDNWIEQGGKIDVPFLNKIFSWIEVDSIRYQELIDKVKIDVFLEPFIRYLKLESIDFMILSAGFDLYIHDALKKLGLEDIKVMTNPGKYENNRLLMTPHPEDKFYSNLYGIDKGKVVASLRDDFDVIYFAGDSEPDLQAAKKADVVFAKELLAELMDKEGLTYHAYDSFEDIYDQLRKG